MACLFDPEVRKVRQRLGTLNTAWIGRVPNLPNVPNLFPPRIHTHTRAHARTSDSIHVRKVRKVRKLKHWRGFQPS